MTMRTARHRSSRSPRRAIVAVALLLIVTGGGVAPVGAAYEDLRTAASSPCRPTDLDAAISHQGVTDTTLVHISITTTQPDTDCTLAGQPQLQLWDAGGNLLVASPPPGPSAGEPVALSAGVGAGASFQWSNWCGSQKVGGAPPPIDGPITAIVILPGDAGQLVAHPAGTMAEEGPLGGGPPCLGPDQPSQLFPVKPFEALPGASLGPPGGLPFYVAAPFLAYWRMHGGLAILGYPLSREVAERLADGKTYRVQYFERARLEYHPENAAPDDVLLGQLGRAAHPAEPPAAPLPDALYFAETGHNVRAGFLDYWQANGGLVPFGYPLSEEFTEQLADGNAYTVQYFERARFEWHPEAADPQYQVQLGQLGRQLYTAQADSPLPQTPAAGICGAAQGALATVRVNIDVPLPRCQRVQPWQRLMVVNKTDQPVRAQLGPIDVTITPQGEWTSDRPFGTYLAPGVHSLALSAYTGGGAELWLQP